MTLWMCHNKSQLTKAEIAVCLCVCVWYLECIVVCFYLRVGLRSYVGYLGQKEVRGQG